ncbi:MAG: branched-chain amino acid ABC transporter permease [Rhodoferax sp.]
MRDVVAIATPTADLSVAVSSKRPRALDAPRLLAGLFFALGLGFAGTAWYSGDVFYLGLATEALIFGGLALSVDLLLGYTGLLPLGQALYFGLGAYVAAWVLLHWSHSFWVALIVAVGASLFAGAVGGLIAIRAKGVYFALISFGLAEVASKIVFNTPQVGGSDGIIGVPSAVVLPGLSSSNAVGFFLFTLAALGVLYASLAYLMSTPFGRQLAAIRENEHRLAFLGFDSRRYKLAVFVLAACIAGGSGALYPMLRGFVSPELMYFQVSTDAVINVIIGGAGTLIGPLYGAALLTGLRSAMGSFTVHHQIVIGTLFVVVVILLPRGLVGYAITPLQHWLDSRKEKRS